MRESTMNLSMITFVQATLHSQGFLYTHKRSVRAAQRQQAVTDVADDPCQIRIVCLIGLRHFAPERLVACQRIRVPSQLVELPRYFVHPSEYHAGVVRMKALRDIQTGPRIGERLIMLPQPIVAVSNAVEAHGQVLMVSRVR